MGKKTIKVRAAVAVAPDGSYCILGCTVAGQRKPKSVPDSELRENAIESLDRSVVAVHFITADVPLPEAQELTGEVES